MVYFSENGSIVVEAEIAWPRAGRFAAPQD